MRKVKGLAQGHIASKLRNWDFNLIIPISEPRLPATQLHWLSEWTTQASPKPSNQWALPNLWPLQLRPGPSCLLFKPNPGFSGENKPFGQRWRQPTSPTHVSHIFYTFNNLIKKSSSPLAEKFPWGSLIANIVVLQKLLLQKGKKISGRLSNMNCWKMSLPSTLLWTARWWHVSTANEHGIPKAIDWMNQVNAQPLLAPDFNFPTVITILLWKSFLGLSAAPRSWIVT